ncbi:mitotic checkpoint protein-domain-containing protein [Syncephalis plumigaleata]|nr:mitotic checkpoint protein-domain-containing protein [Syncephalis plumigaleata]
MNPPSKRPRKNNTNESDIIRDAGADNPFLVATPAQNARARLATESEESAPPSVSLANYTAGTRTTRVAPSLATVNEASSSVATARKPNPFGTDATRPLYSYTAVRPNATRPIAPTTGYPTTLRRSKMPMQYSVEPTPARATRNAISADLLDSTRINRWLDAATGTKMIAKGSQGGLSTTLNDRLASTSEDIAEENENIDNENDHDCKQDGDKDVSLLNLDAYVLEAVEAKQKVGELVYQLAAQRTETERKLLEAATFAQRLQQQLKERIQRVEKLEEDRRYLYAIDSSTKAKLEELKETHERYQSEKEKEIARLQESEAKLKSELAVLRETARSDQSGSYHQIKTLQTKNQGYEQELELLRQKTLQATGDSSVTGAINAKRLQTDYYRTTERKASLLEEEKKRLMARMEQMEIYRSKYDELEVECSLLRKEKSEWADFLANSSNDATMTSPYKMSSTLMSQRMELVALTEQQGELQARIRQLELNLENAQQLELEAKREADQCEIKRYQRKHKLAQKEIDFLREQVSSYDIENAMQSGDNYDKQKTERIAMLEKLIDEYQQEIHGASTLSTSSSNNNNSDKALLDKIESLTAENQALSQQVTTQDDYITRLEHSTGHGDYDRANIRVLEFSDNLAVQDFAIRESTLESLRKENKELLDKLKQYRGMNRTTDQDEEQNTKLEGGEGEGGEPLDTVPFQSLLNEQAEKARLVEELAIEAKRMRRLREIFAAKGRELRDVIYSLLGYKLELLPNGRVRLTSAYSSRDDHSFVFSSDGNDRGVMQLVNSGNDDFANSLQNLIRLWVGERGSIPAFLSAVTLELFERQDNPIGVGGMRVMDMSNDDIELGAFNRSYSFLTVFYR